MPNYARAPLFPILASNRALFIMKRVTGKDMTQWSREELIRHIQELEGVISGGKRQKKHDKARPIDFSAYPTRRVAFKLAYFGWKYHGFASQMSYKDDGSESDNPKAPLGNASVVTVEDVLFEALMRTKLIQSPKTCAYSRCGRTDAGVSSTGQVIALNVRSTKKALPSGEEAISEVEDISTIACILNRTLPEDIRILAYSPAGEAFNARFSCIGRKYKYFFSGHGLDIEAMREAASKLVGTHDFRHFCRKDPSKNIQNYQRIIYSACINLVDEARQFYEFEIHGSAFLYHQVRCTMALLFLVGAGKERPEVIEHLIKIAATEQETPKYEMASEVPLVLYDCFYPKECNLNFVDLPGNDKHLDGDLYKLWEEHYIKATTVDLVLRGRSTSSFGKSPQLLLANHSAIYKPTPPQ